MEVLTDPTYLRVCRGVLAFRVLAAALTAAITPPESALTTALLLGTTILSGWGMLSDAFVRAYFRHPILPLLDSVLVILVVWREWPETGALLVLALTGLLTGLALTPWLGLPALLITVAAITLKANEPGPDDGTPASMAVAVGLPVSIVATIGLGWTVRYAFVELKRTRDQVMAETVLRRHQEERSRLARDMHDSLGKTVNGISLAAAALESATSQGDLRTARELAAEVRKAATIAADESRGLLRGLRRGQDDRPLAEQLGEVAREHATETRAVRTTIAGLVELPRPVGAEMLAITQEALENVDRHSHARNVHVQLYRDEAEIVLEVSDDGRGFDLEAVPGREREGHFGLRGMHERAESLGGRCEVVSAPGEGTRVTCRWPAEILEGAS